MNIKFTSIRHVKLCYRFNAHQMMKVIVPKKKMFGSIFVVEGPKTLG